MNGITIFWYFVFALAGTLVGILIGRWIERRSKPAVQNEVSTDKSTPEADPGILRVGRATAGKIWLEMDGKHMGDKTEINTDLRQKLLNIVLELRPWLEGGKESSLSPVIAPTAPAKPKAPKQEKKEPPPPPMKSIIEQVNDVLQARLAETAMKDRGIKLIEGSNGSVIVQDGLNRYEGLEAVPDAEITTLIRAAITEWEKTAK